MHSDHDNPALNQVSADWLTAYLRSAAANPWSATAPLLGHRPALGRLDLHATPTGTGAPGIGDLLITLTTPEGGQVDALAKGPLVRGLVGLLLDEDPGPPAPVSAAEAGLLAGLATAVLADLGLGSVGIQDVAVVRDDGSPTALSATPDLGCRLAWDCGPAGGDLTLWLDTTATTTLADAARAWQPSPNTPGDEATVVADLVLARTTLTPDQLTRLQPGDAVVFPVTAPPEDAWPLQLHVAGRRFDAILCRTEAGRELQIRDRVHPQTTTPSPQPSQTLSAVLGQVSLTASAVTGLGPDASVTLDQPVGQVIVLKLGRRTIGSGELLEIDGSVAIRLASLTG